MRYIGFARYAHILYRLTCIDSVLGHVCWQHVLLMRSICKCICVAVFICLAILLLFFSLFVPLNFCTRWQMTSVSYCHFDSNVWIQYALANAWNDLLTIICTEKKETNNSNNIHARLQMNFLINAYRVARHGMYLSPLDVIKFAQQTTLFSMDNGQSDIACQHFFPCQLKYMPRKKKFVFFSLHQNRHLKCVKQMHVKWFIWQMFFFPLDVDNASRFFFLLPFHFNRIFPRYVRLFYVLFFPYCVVFAHGCRSLPV